MKRFNRLLFVTILTVALFATPAFAFGFGDIKGLVGKVGWEAVAYGLTALLAIGGMVARAKWLSALFLVGQTTFACVATLFETIASVFGWAGTALQDGKLSADEIKQAPEMIYQAKESIKQTWNTVKTAWGSLIDA